jgi:hypothetical protein
MTRHDDEHGRKNANRFFERFIEQRARRCTGRDMRRGFFLLNVVVWVMFALVAWRLFA